MEQMNFFDMIDSPEEPQKQNGILEVVKAKFLSSEQTDWEQLFGGYDELHAITYSSGLEFTSKVIENYKYAEIIYGCEDILPNGVGAILALETSLIERITKSKVAKKLSERLAEGTLSLYVSRNKTSHEKIYCLKASDGRVRVIVGSANLSQSAFENRQRENITYYDDEEAYEWYMKNFRSFKEECSDNVNQKVIERSIEDTEYLADNPEEIPLLNTVKEKKYVFLEPVEDREDADLELITNVKNLEHELKPMLPKIKKQKGKLSLSYEDVVPIRKTIRDITEKKRETSKQFPKLHLDYEKQSLNFNGTEYNLAPERDAVIADLNCLEFFLTSLQSFHGDYTQAQSDYYRFMNWFFASLFMPYLRYIADKNNYDVTTLPVFGIMYGDSNGGKSTFVQLLTKLMTGKKIPTNGSGDFTYSTVEKLRCGIEGVPINFDDLDKQQFRNHADKIIKEDEWGIPERFFNYPSVVITTNKVPSLEAPILKRVVSVRIDVRIGKEEGLTNSRKLKESIRKATTAFYSEYVRRMIPAVLEMADRMKAGKEERYADIFALSARTIVQIYQDYLGTVPSYIKELAFSDYFGDRIVGRGAIKRIKDAWNNEAQSFKIDRKKNTLSYLFPESTSYEAKYIKDELPAQLNARVLSRSLIMDLREAENFFGIKFKKKLGDRMKRGM